MKRLIKIMFLLILLSGCSNKNNNISSKIDYTKINTLELLYDLKLEEITKINISNYEVKYDLKQEEFEMFYDLLNVEYSVYEEDDYDYLRTNKFLWYIIFDSDVNITKSLYQIDNHIMFKMYRLDDDCKIQEYIYISNKEIIIEETLNIYGE